MVQCSESPQFVNAQQPDPSQAPRGSEEISEYYNVKDVQLALVIMAVAVVGLFLYLARDIILRRKTGYEEKDLESKRNRDYEKYHSPWNEDEDDFISSTKKSKDAEEFRRQVQESSLPDYYAMLGVPNDADQKMIKARFRQLVKELHPDKSKDEKTAERLAEISKAYKILSDAEKRKTYDAYYKASVG
ncbi:DnaJ domain-containing protein [Candidatus Nitrosotenuis sp. DW1]|uniref:DnaJ domain-containing protein n=1 Tax=Candidatus Nitrosotenuis sp. DW1 TaxID=2259672 RepID=UPI0015C96286|nr:DnaJ domain-containing protein [Candidatus Nitrosotenuis sp. DW1]